MERIEKPTEMEKLMTMTGEKDPRVLMVYLDQAEQAVASFIGTDTRKVRHYVIDLAAYRIVKRGADYQTGHSENGVSRNWSSDMMDAPAGFWDALKRSVDQLEIKESAGWII